jgi:hypothetical protein
MVKKDKNDSESKTKKQQQANNQRRLQHNGSRALTYCLVFEPNACASNAEKGKKRLCWNHGRGVRDLGFGTDSARLPGHTTPRHHHHRAAATRRKRVRGDK